MTNDSFSLTTPHRNHINTTNKSSTSLNTATNIETTSSITNRIDDDFRIILSDVNSAAYEACKNGDITLVRQLISPSNVNKKDSNGRKSTFLHFAAGFGRKEVCEYLLYECKADPSIKDEG